MKTVIEDHLMKQCGLSGIQGHTIALLLTACRAYYKSDTAKIVVYFDGKKKTIYLQPLKDKKPINHEEFTENPICNLKSYLTKLRKMIQLPEEYQIRFVNHMPKKVKEAELAEKDE